jgi:hypothetical protein
MLTSHVPPVLFVTQSDPLPASSRVSLHAIFRAEECRRAGPLSTWGPSAVLVCVLVVDLVGHAARLSQIASLQVAQFV